MKSIHFKKGFGLVEVVIASGIIALVIGALVGTSNAFFKSSISTTSAVKAGYLLEEGAEALRLIRDRGYTSNITTLSNNTSYYLTWTNNNWSTSTATTSIDSVFYRTIKLGSVYRDFNSNIASSGTLDANTRIATVTVAWFDNNKNATTSKSLVLYISNLFKD
jgi:type II secretory pathway pseudopilin PulG